MREYPFSLIQKDFISLKQYVEIAGDSIEIQTIHRRLSVKYDNLNKEIPKSFYDRIIDKNFSEKKIRELSDIFIDGIPKSIAQEFLTINQNKKIFVKEDRFLEWQNIISDMSPAFLIASFLFSLDDLKSAFTSLQMNDLDAIRNFFQEYILGNCEYSSLISPDIFPLNELCKKYNGFKDLHIHLNGISEMDTVWQNLLCEKDKNLINIVNALGSDSFQYQLEQIGFYYENYEAFLSRLIDKAQEIRCIFFNTIINNEVEYKDCSKENRQNPFAFLFNDSSRIYDLPSQGISIEILMYCLVLVYLQDSGGNKKIASLLHEYLLIYGFFEELLILPPEKIGFDHFQDITKNEIREESDKQQVNKFFQLCGNDNQILNFAEFRISPKDTEEKMIGYLNDIERKWKKFKKDIFFGVDYSIIPHFIKKKDKALKNDDEDDSKCNYINFYELRYDLKKRCNILISTMKKFGKRCKIKGVDAAASEFDTPPEVFAPIFSQLRNSRVVNHFTFHAGEDFYHILSGLRTIYETVYFLDFSHGDRIGHASATGTDVNTWADILRNEIYMPQGIYLDDLIFSYSFILEEKIEQLYYKLPLIEKKIKELCYKIYNQVFDIEILISSWKNRKYDPNLICKENSNELLFGIKENATESSYEYVKVKDMDFFVLKKYNSLTFRKKYKQSIQITVFEIFNSNELEILQKKVLSYLHKREIVIETLPTSNLRIGYHRNLSSYQLFNWYKWKKEGESIPPIVLGTDDPGIFATNIYNEYAMVYCYLVYEKKQSRDDVIKFLEDICRNSSIYAFRE